MFKTPPEVSKLRHSNFHTCTTDYLKYLRYTFSFPSDNCSLSYRSSTQQHDLEASRVVFGHSEKFIGRRFAVHNSVHSITFIAELSCEMLRALSSKTKSVGADQSVIFN